MKVMNLVQGTPEWHAYRAAHFNASDAPAMMGVSKHTSRNALIHRIATGEVEEVAPAQQALYDRGHAAEAAVRPKIEAALLEELHPVIGECDTDPSLSKLSASYDGLTLDETTGIEVKLWNQDLVAQVRAGEIADPHYWVQLEQHFIVNEKLRRLIFVVTKEDASEYETLEYTPVAGRRESIIAGWAQLEKDAAAYVQPVAKPAVVAAPVETLPAIVYTINRSDLTITHNLPVYRKAADALIERTKAPLVTDQDFADRKALAKKFREYEVTLKSKADEVIGQMADIAALHRDLKDAAEVMRKAAIDAENKVEAEEKNRKQAIIDAGKQAMRDHMAALNARFDGRVTVPAPAFDPVAAAKGKRTPSSMQDAVDTAVAQAKIAANAVADCMTENMVFLDNNATDHLFLFRDLQQIVTLPYEAFSATVRGRVAEHKANEQARIEAEAKRLLEEQQKAAQQPAQAEPAVTTAATPASVQAPPTSAPAAIPASQPAMKTYAELRKPARPNDAEMIAVLAAHYDVKYPVVIGWLRTMNLNEAQEA